MESLDYRAVLGYLQDHAKGLVNVAAEEQRYKRMVTRAMLNVTSGAWLERMAVYLDVKNGMAKLPCNLVRILRVRDDKECKIDWNRKGGNDFITVKMRQGRIKLRYYAIPLKEVDIQGNKELLPVVQEFQIEYCGAYIMEAEMLIKLTKQEIAPAIYQIWEQRANQFYTKAKGGSKLISMDEMDKAAWMMRNGMKLSPY